MLFEAVFLFRNKTKTMYRNSKRSLWFRTMSVMSFYTSVVVDRASFKKTLEMAKVKSFDCQLQISKSTTLLQMSVNFYAVLSLSLCIVPTLHSFPGPLLDQSPNKSSNFFPKLQKTPKLQFSRLFSSITF